MASVRAHSDGGIAHPKFHDRTMPAPLAEAGMNQAAWLALLAAGDEAVVFQWGCRTICCFMSFAHHKDIKPRMTRFVEELNSGSTHAPTTCLRGTPSSMYRSAACAVV